MAAHSSVRRALAALRALFLSTLLCVTVSALAVAAHAQDASDPDPTSGDEPNAESVPPDQIGEQPNAPPPPEGVEEITVIGEVLETSTQAEAEAITTFDQAELDTLGITDVDTLALNTPSLHVGQVGQQAVITLRGVGLENLTSIGETGVGFQVDGVHLARPAAANAAFFDVERVDVLRGPQGTRGGRNLNGGKIAVWSAKPTEEFEAKGDATYGNYNTMESRAVINVPIWSDKLMSRVSGIFARRTGFQDNEMYGVTNKNTGDAKDYTGRLQLRSLLFDQSLELRGIATHGKQEGRGPDLKLIGSPSSNVSGAIAQFTNGWQRIPAGQTQPLHNQPFIESRYFPTPCPSNPNDFSPDNVCVPNDVRDAFLEFVSDRDNHQNGLTGLGTYDIPLFQDTPFSDLRLGVVGAWQQTSEDWIYDFDGTNVPEQVLDLARNAHQYSIEAYIERPDVGRWDFRAGFYHLNESITTNVCFDINGPQTVQDFAYRGQIGTKSIAGYGEAGFRITENLRAYGGIRWTNDEKRNDELFRSVDPVIEITLPTNVPDYCGHYTRSLIARGQRPGILSDPGGAKSTENYDGLTPMGAIDWQVTDTSTLSFSVTRGFKAGGFPTVVDPRLNSLDKAYDSEFTMEYELTSKNELWDGRLRLNTTAFWTEYDPFQVCQFNGPAYLCDSNGSATIRGVEIEYILTPIEGLQVNGFFNWLDSRINNMQLIDPTIRACQQPGCPSLQQPPESIATALLPVDVSGNRLTRSPEWAGSFGVQYEFDFGRWGFFTPRFATQFQGLTYYRVFNSYDDTTKRQGLFYLTDDKQEPFIKYDAKIMWRSEDDRFTAEVFGVNLSDEDVLNSVIVGSQFSGGQALGQYQPPRMYGIRVGINYISDWLPEF
ncbi:MAG TPA: TonB-dependent receptor [Myxococcota bacterium]|nr:TonB-dependent receptor [Myxococcota bacterium]